MTEREEARREIETWTTLLARHKPPPGCHYAGMGGFLKEHGVWYEPTEFPQHIKQGLPKMCFGNAIIAAAQYDFRYIEGLAYAPNLFSFHHAWNVDGDGKLVDTTWLNTGLAYYGVEFSVERADDATWNGDSSVLNDFLRKHPLFRQPWKGEDYSIKWPRSERIEMLRQDRRLDLLSWVWQQREEGL